MLAAELLGPGAARSEALLQACHWLLTAGDTAAAAELLATAGTPGTPLELLVRGELALLDGDQRAARRLLEDAMAAGPGPDVAARVAGLLATIAANAARADEAIAWARRALEHSIESGTDASYAMTMLVSGWALQGDLRAGEEEVAGVGRPPGCHRQRSRRLLRPRRAGAVERPVRRRRTVPRRRWSTITTPARV